MSSYGNFRPAYGSRGREVGQSAAASAFMFSVYRWMSLGLAVTGVTAWYVAQSAAAVQLIFGNRWAFYGLLIAQLALVVAFTPVAVRASSAAAAAMFLAYSALTGVTFSFIFLRYTQASVAQTFFVTAGSFAGLAFFGATTKRDLSAVGRFMMIGLFGFIIASLVNLWLQSPAIYWVSTYAGVLIFAGLTAYETQRLRDMYLTEGGGGNLALRGALVMYLDFVNLFLMLLRLFGNERR
jgi:FtsH-binding integral membrane protein